MPNTESLKITDYFGVNLAELISEKLHQAYPDFDFRGYQAYIGERCEGLSYTQRVELHADGLRRFLPEDYVQSVRVLVSILGEENPEETGMFKHFYWVLPIGKFVEKYGLDHFSESMAAIAEITKRNTGEYAVRPYIRMYPEESLKIIETWAVSGNFHLRRLASEGLRPKLPWATKLDVFIEEPDPVFQILELLREDPVKFVQKSVANHLTDYLKVNPEPTRALIRRWQTSGNPNTQWILKHATRKIQ